MDILEIKMPCISKDGMQFNVTPPLLFRFQYIDQDEGWSKIADSFSNVAYIKDWKSNINKYVCGYLDDTYYALQAPKAEHMLERDDKKRELNYNQTFVSPMQPRKDGGRYEGKENPFICRQQGEIITFT